MNIKNADVFNSKTWFEKLLRLELNAKTAFAIIKLVNELNIHLKAITDTQLFLLDKYGDDDGKGHKEITLGSVNLDAYANGLNEVLEADTEISLVNPIDVSLGDSLVEPAMLLGLSKFINFLE